MRHSDLFCGSQRRNRPGMHSWLTRSRERAEEMAVWASEKGSCKLYTLLIGRTVIAPFGPS